MDDLPDLTAISIPELMQELQEVELADPRASWSFEQVIEHACCLAMGYGAGRDDLREEYKATKERALRMARQSRVRIPTSVDDNELAAAGGDQWIADLLTRWETDRGEWFGNPTLEIVAEYAAWRERMSE